MAAEVAFEPSESWRIALVGAGALGNAVLPLLFDVPIGKFTIIDGDRVEQSNLERQPLFDARDVGRSKSSVLAELAQRRMGHNTVIGYDGFLGTHNAHELLRGHDLVLEGVDDLHAKTLIDRVCAEICIPLVSAAVHGTQGQVILLHATGVNEALTRADLFEGPQGGEQDGCDMRHVPLSLLAEVAERMIARLRDVLDARSVTNGRLELLDRVRGGWMVVDPVP